MQRCRSTAGKHNGHAPATFPELSVVRNGYEPRRLYKRSRRERPLAALSRKFFFATAAEATRRRKVLEMGPVRARAVPRWVILAQQYLRLTARPFRPPFPAMALHLR